MFGFGAQADCSPCETWYDNYPGMGPGCVPNPPSVSCPAGQEWDPGTCECAVVVAGKTGPDAVQPPVVHASATPPTPWPWLLVGAAVGYAVVTYWPKGRR
jgi:hypothetical protein